MFSDQHPFWSWSLKLYRTSTLEVRASWMLGAWIIFDVISFARHGFGAWSLLPVLVIPVSMYLHAMAHVGVAILVGGSASRTVLTVLNDRTDLEVPLSPAKQFATAIAGPLVSLLLWLSSAMIAKGVDSNSMLVFPVAYIAGVNFWVFVLNLLACAIFDGARMWRALLWPLLGLSRAIRGTVFLSYISAIGLIAWAIWATSWLILFLGISCLLGTILEHRTVRQGFDPILQIEYESVAGRRPQSWFARWQQRRRIRAQERREREEHEEQQMLDRLLTKVSEQGLPSLTAAERSMLQRISRKEKERQETGST